ncbi:MAG: NADP-dependent malic enzyme [Bacteriovoracaceae bacterium]|jgi:malate dehydrogenase (oxaloacetate-decarboxylating)(NADP+)|nr:NADP-dependent malic enzyme [Bacteriovoracaceae bacterium]
MNDQKKKQALDYHSTGRPGKIEVISTKPCVTADELSLAYSPGVAEPCLEIANNPEEAYKYTAKGNLVGVISNGSAVLGLGNIGALAGKPVMEGKGVLFKKFADIDVFDIEINCDTVDEMVTTISHLEPTFGGINLEDIKAPECFEVEKRLQELNIPVFHDDQHGTAIIATAGFMNALELTNRKIEDTKVVFSGAGAASMAIAKLFFRLGLKPQNLLMCDSKGVIYKGRKEGMNPYKEDFAVDTDCRTIADAMKDADAFMGCSAQGVINQEMVKTMAKDPIIFAMANPNPEILPEQVAEVRDDAIMATGRTDYPNQVNNVLGFPFIFRGALDVRAKKINEQMKIAAVMALANLAKEEVPDEVKNAYDGVDFKFGKDYLIPKPFDKRVLTRVAPAVAKAAMDTGVSRIEIEDFTQYALELEARMGQSAAFMRSIRQRIPSKSKKKVVFAEGTNTRVLQAVSTLVEEKKIDPILLGTPALVIEKMEELGLTHLKEKVEIIRPVKSEHFNDYANAYHEERKRLGATLAFSIDRLKSANYFGSMMVKKGHADAMITGASTTYPNCFKPIMRVAGGQKKAAGVMILVYKDRVLFLADCTSQKNPNAHDLSEIAISTTELYKKLMKKDPAVAFLSYSNFGSNLNSETKKMKEASELTKEKMPNLMVDGEMQADVAVNDTIIKNMFKFSDLDRSADILIFPDLQSANISYKLLSQLSDCTAIGPVLAPMEHPINIVQRTSTVEQIINMSHLTALLSLEK